MLKFREQLWLVLQKNKADNKTDKGSKSDETEGESTIASNCPMPRDWFPNHWLPFVIFGKFSGDPNPILEGSKDDDAKPLNERVNSRVHVRQLTEASKNVHVIREEVREKKNGKLKSAHALDQLKKELKEMKDYFHEESNKSWRYLKWQNQLAAMDTMIKEAIDEGVDENEIKEMKQKRRKVMFADPFQEESLFNNASFANQSSTSSFPNQLSNFVDESCSIIASSDNTSFNDSVYTDNDEEY